MSSIALQSVCVVVAIWISAFSSAHAIEFPVLNSKAAIAAAQEVCRGKASESRKWVTGLDRDRKAWSVITMPETSKGDEKPWVTNIPVFGPEEPPRCENAYYYSFSVMHGGSPKIDELEIKLAIQQQHAEGAKCVLPEGAVTSLRINDLPTKLRKLMPGLGGVDEAYQSDGTPGHDHLPSAHLIRLYRKDRRWVILYGKEAGLGELSRHVQVIEANQDGSLKRLISDKEVKWGHECDFVSDRFEMR